MLKDVHSNAADTRTNFERLMPMTIFQNQNLTIVSAAARGCQVQVPGNNIDLTAGQTRQLAIAPAFVLATHSKGAPITSVATIDFIYNDENVIEEPLVTPFSMPGLIVAVPLGDGTFYPTLLTDDQARLMANTIAAYTVVG
jgi:hypothetical protein